MEEEVLAEMQTTKKKRRSNFEQNPLLLIGVVFLSEETLMINNMLDFEAGKV